MPSLKSLLVKTGARLGPGVMHRIDAAVSYLAAGRWAAERGFRTDRPAAASREELFDAVGAAVGDRQVLYLEFGVAFGDSMRHFSRVLRNPGSALHGFDSFEGLPEDWNPYTPKGAYSTDGQIPAIEDERVRFFKGLFQDTLPGYEPPEHEALVVNVDCDIYSSAAYVLAAVEPWIAPGTFVYFDELCDRNNELRAFDELLERSGYRFQLEGATPELRHALFRRVA